MEVPTPQRPRTAARGALAAALALGVLSGCGNDRSKPPAVAVAAPPTGTQTGSFPAEGVTFTAPGGWNLVPGAAPLVASVSTGQAVVSVYRYPRTEPLPKSKAQLAQAADAIVAAAAQRDPTFKLLAKDTVQVAGAPAVVLRGTETVLGQPRTVRSTHIYKIQAEYVVDALAPAADFKRVDEQVFRPLTRSLKLRRPGSGTTGASGSSGSSGTSGATGTTP